MFFYRAARAHATHLPHLGRPRFDQPVSPVLSPDHCHSLRLLAEQGPPVPLSPDPPSPAGHRPGHRQQQQPLQRRTAHAR